MFRGFSFGRHWLGRLVTELPILFDFHSTIFECELVGRRKFVDSLVDRKRRGHVVERQVLSQSLKIEARSDGRMGQQDFRLGREYQRAVENAPVKWLLSKTIARDKESTSAAVPKREGKHAVELADHSVAVLFVQMRQHFGVRSATKLVTAFFEIGAQLAIVVDLAVENYSD